MGNLKFKRDIHRHRSVVASPVQRHLHPSHGILDFLLSPSLPDGNLLCDMTQGGQVVIGEVGAAQDLMTGRHFKLGPFGICQLLDLCNEWISFDIRLEWAREVKKTKQLT